jgi:hypothetical protein
MYEGEIVPNDIAMQSWVGWAGMESASLGVHLREPEMLSTDWLYCLDCYGFVADVNRKRLLLSVNSGDRYSRSDVRHSTRPTNGQETCII